MRSSLLNNFDNIWIDNLHGNRLASERTPWDDSCETIFNTQTSAGIRVGTCITTMLKRHTGKKNEVAKVLTRDFWGTASKKRAALVRSLKMETWTQEDRAVAAEDPEGPRTYDATRPTNSTAWRLTARSSPAGFEDWPSLDDLFPNFYQGVNPNREGYPIAEAVFH